MTINMIFFLCAVFICLFSSLFKIILPSPDKTGTPVGMCSYAVFTHGFKCQEYNVTTEDGYILSVQRIPEGRRGGGGNRQPVLLQHGLFVDGKSWLENSAEQSLAMMLADNGFDVWISNLRGTRFSKRHVSIDSVKPEFWDWSFSDLASHDVPSVIDLVFNETGQKTHYVGHSMGTMVALALLSEGKFGNVKSAALLSPIAYLSHITSPVVHFGTASFFAEINNNLNIAVGEFNPKGVGGANFLKALCATIDCTPGSNLLSGNDCCLNKTVLTNFFCNDIQSTSTKNLDHFAQDARTGIFSKFNYNIVLNVEKYGAPTPPVYDMSKIPSDFPLFMSCGGRDALANPQDVAALIDALNAHDKDKLQVQFVPQYAHLDFIYGVDANKIVYDGIIEFFKKYN